MKTTMWSRSSRKLPTTAAEDLLELIMRRHKAETGQAEIRTRSGKRAAWCCQRCGTSSERAELVAQLSRAKATPVSIGFGDPIQRDRISADCPACPESSHVTRARDPGESTKRSPISTPNWPAARATAPTAALATRSTAWESWPTTLVAGKVLTEVGY